MTEPKKFSKGKHTYTKYGHNFKEVKVQGKPKPAPQQQNQMSVSIDMDHQTAMGVYANMTIVHQSDSEVVLDFVFLPPGQKKGRTRSRVILPVKQAKKLAEILSKDKGN